jgi:hypothetical protein
MEGKIGSLFSEQHRNACKNMQINGLWNGPEMPVLGRARSGWTPSCSSKFAPDGCIRLLIQGTAAQLEFSLKGEETAQW